MAVVDSNVIRMRPALRTVVEAASDAFGAGDYRRALALVAGFDDLACTAIRLRILHRYGCFAEAARSIAPIDPGRLEEATPAQAAIFCALGSRALRVDNDERGERLWSTFARLYAAVARDARVEAELSCLFGEPEAAYASGEPRLIASAHEINAQEAARRHGFSEAIAHARESLIANDRCAVPDRWLEADAIACAAVWSAAVDDRDAIEFFSDRYHRFAWCDQLATRQSLAAYQFGAAYAAMNNVVAALRYLREAARREAAIPQRIAALALRAEIAAEIGQSATAAGSLQAAARLAFANDWSWTTCPPESRIPLLQLAAAFSAIDPLRARELGRLGNETSVRSLHAQATPARDAAARATAALAHGRLDAAAGEVALARTRLTDAFATFVSLEHRAQAALCAIELRRLDVVTKDVVDVLETIERRFENSWIAKRAARGSERPPDERGRDRAARLSSSAEPRNLALSDERAGNAPDIRDAHRLFVHVYAREAERDASDRAGADQ
jgi:hypothetical protein